MRWDRFETKVPAKWVLAGEHAVLRGATAVALPHPEHRLTLRFTPGDGFSIAPDEARVVVQELLDSVREDREAQDYTFTNPRGRLEIESTIPIGAGLGSSAALCVAMTRWLAEPLSIPRESELEFATRLEHRFHGRSSGMDVAVIATGEPISFAIGRGPKTLGIRRLPRFTFHDTRLRARTSECVYRVGKIREDDPALGMRIDEAMGTASRLAMEGLMAYDRGSREAALKTLASAMDQAQECFLSWQLVPGEARRLRDDLLRQGALSAKITGAGGGGMLVALWSDPA